MLLFFSRTIQLSYYFYMQSQKRKILIIMGKSFLKIVILMSFNIAKIKKTQSYILNIVLICKTRSQNIRKAKTHQNKNE